MLSRKALTRTRTLGIVSLLLCLAAPFAGAEVIDDFETTQAQLTDTGASVVTDNGVDVILGDHRELEIELVEGTAGATVEAAAGSLSFDATAGVDTRAAASLVWDADTNTTVFDGDGLGGVDLTDHNRTAFRVEVASASADTQILLEVFTDDGNSSKAGLRLPSVGATTDFFLSFADFIPNLGTGADFSDVGAIVMRIQGTDVTADISHFETVGPTLTVTKIDIDPDDDMDYGTDPAVPGDTIRYEIQITNTGGLAQQVDLADTVDGNTTFTADSLTATPVALVDTVAVLGNVTRTVADPGVLANDEDPDGDALFVRITNSDSTSAEGATVVWNDAGADDQGEGGFQYFPPAGFRGVDSFAYELEDADGQTAAGQVTVILDRIIWFVDDDHSGPFEGTLANPFADFTQLDDSANDVDGDGDIIFVYAHSGGNYSHAGLELEPGQSLIGEGEGLTVDGSVIVPAGASALIHANDPGAPVAHGALLTMNNTIRGVTFGDTEGFAISGAGAGTLTVSNTAVTGAGGILDVDSTTLAVDFGAVSSNAGGGTAIDLTGVDGSFEADSTTINGCPGSINVSNAAAASTFDFGPTSIGGGAGAGPVLASSGSATFTFDSLDVTTTGTALDVNTAGTVNLGGATNTLETTTAGAAILAQVTSMGAGGWTFDNVTSDNSPSVGILLNSMTGGNFLVTGATDINEPMANGIEVSTGGARTYDFGSTGISGAGSVVPLSGGRGVNLIFGNSMSSFVFDSLNVTTDNGAGLVTNGVGLLAIAGTTNSIVANNGNALWLESTTVDELPGGPVTGITFATLSSANSPLDGINLQFVTGSVTGDTGSISGALDAAVRIGSGANNSGGSGDVTYAGSITNTQDLSVSIQERNGGAVTLSGNIDDTGIGILVQNNNNGVANTITFSGSSKILNTGANTAVLLDNNDDAVVSFTGGGLDIDTSGAVTAFNAINGGTVQVTGPGNSVNTTAGTGVAVNINATTIGATGVTFQRVDVSGAPNGIVLDTTGNTGSFLVSGDGTMTAGVLNRNDSGGVLSNTTDDGVFLNTAHSVTLRQMAIRGVGNSANPLDTTLLSNDHAIESRGGSSIVLSAVHIQNPIGTGWEAFDLGGINRIDHGSLIEELDQTSNFNGFRVRNDGVSFTSITLDNCTFDHKDPTPGDAATNGNAMVVLSTRGDSSGSWTATGSTFTGARGQAMTLAIGDTLGSTGTVTTVISDNLFEVSHLINGQNNLGLSNQQATTHNVTVTGNTFRDVGRGASLSGQIIAQKNHTAILDASISGNTISEIDAQRGIDVLSLSTSSGGRVDAEIFANNINDVGREAIYVSARGNEPDMDVRIFNNTQIGDVTAVGFQNGAPGIHVELQSSAQLDLQIDGNSVRAASSSSFPGNGGAVLLITTESFPSAPGTINATVEGNTLTSTNGANNGNFLGRARDCDATVNIDLGGAGGAAGGNPGDGVANVANGTTSTYRILDDSFGCGADAPTVTVENLTAVNAENTGTVTTTTVTDFVGDIPKPDF